MIEWKKSELESITSLIKDGSHGTHKDVSDGIPLLSAKDINEGKLAIPDDCRKILQTDYELIHANYQIENDDLLMTIVGTIGRVAIVKEINKRFTFQRSVAIIRLKQSMVTSDYAFHYLQSNDFQQDLDRSINASAQGGVYLGTLSKLKLRHPVSITEQQRIAKILSTADAVIEKTQAAIAKYKAIKQGMLQDLFTRGIDLNTNKLRPRYQDAPELYKESKLGWIPSEWDVKQLGDLCSMKSGDGITSEKIYELGDYPVYGGNGLRGYTTKFTHDGEFTLIGRQGALCGNITRVSGKFYASEHAVVVTPENFIELDWLSQKLYSMNLNQYSEATAQPGLSVFKILPLLVETPPFDEQQKIAERLKAIENKLQTEQTYLQKMQSLKKGLMEDLLSGRKQVKISTELKEMA